MGGRRSGAMRGRPSTRAHARAHPLRRRRARRPPPPCLPRPPAPPPRRPDLPPGRLSRRRWPARSCARGTAGRARVQRKAHAPTDKRKKEKKKKKKNKKGLKKEKKERLTRRLTHRAATPSGRHVSPQGLNQARRRATSPRQPIPPQNTMPEARPGSLSTTPLGSPEQQRRQRHHAIKQTRPAIQT
jgi:hypothetical protein